MQVQGSAGKVRATGRSGWGARVSSYPAKYLSRPGFSGAEVGEEKEEEKEGEGRAGAGWLRT